MSRGHETPTGGAAHRITMTPVGDTVWCRPRETVLAAILASGASVRFGCRGGGCGTCKMRAITGQIDHGRPSAAVLSPEDREAGWFLSCQASPSSDLAIELTAANRYRVVFGWHRRDQPDLCVEEDAR
jgi:ferredoxin